MENLAKMKLRNGGKLLGTFFSMGNPSAMECLGYTGMDFAIIDTEHGPLIRSPPWVWYVLRSLLDSAHLCE